MNEPAFHEANGLCSIAAVGVGAQSNLKEAGQVASFVVSNQDGGGKNSAHTGVQDRIDFFGVFLKR